MSLINKMLQDLDARGTGPGGGAQPHIKPVAHAEPSVPLRLVVGALAVALALGVAGAAGWRYLHKAPPAAQPVTVVMAPAGVVAPAPAPALAAVSAAPSAAQVVPAAVPVAVRAPAATAAPAAVQARAPTREDAAAPVATPARTAHKNTPADKVRFAAAQDPAGESAPAARLAHDGPSRHEAEAPAAASGAGKHDSFAAGREETAGQRAEGAYRRALGSLQEGRVPDAMAALRQALQADARHEAARQTLVGLLIEHGQPDEAMHQLQLGLTLDPRQPALAMLLARLQIERGGTGVETLMRTLPYAGANGEYHAFLAGALQRQQRNREAAEQYQAALRGGAQNGVWWMGLGISLAAEKRDAEAVDAFQKAKASGTLSPELLAFVERKLRALR